MKASEKRVRGLRPDLPAEEAAGAVYSFYLKLVERLLPRAASDADADPEYVHQLRIATRRAGAALKAFEGCTDPRQARKAGKMLKRIRKAAGLARDCDVHRDLFLELKRSAPPEAAQIIDLVLDELKALRAEAQKHIEEIFEKYPLKKIARRRARLCSRVHPQPAGDGANGRTLTLGELAQRTVGRAVEDVRKELSVSKDEPEQLHQLRIECKRLRYAFELFEECAPEPERKPAQKALKSLLDTLGELNDAETMLHKVRELPIPMSAESEETRAGFDALVAHVEALRAERLARAVFDARKFAEDRWLDRLLDSLREPASAP